MSKQARARAAASELFYPIMVKQMTDEETKEYHLKRLERLSKNWRSSANDR